MPRTVAILGASRDRMKFGNKAVRAYRQVGYRVYPIHPTETEIEGLTVYRDLRSVPGTIDRVALYVPPRIGITLLEEIATRRPGDLYLNPGTESPELLQRAHELGLEPVQACAIRAIGIDPGTLDDDAAEGGRRR